MAGGIKLDPVLDGNLAMHIKNPESIYILSNFSNSPSRDLGSIRHR